MNDMSELNRMNGRDRGTFGSGAAAGRGQASRRRRGVDSASSQLLVLVLGALLAGVAACASNDLSRAGSPEVIGAALRRSTAVPATPVNQSGRPLAYLVLGGRGGSRLAAFDLAHSKVQWVVAARVTGRVVAGASVVVHADGETLVGRDVATGAERWRTPLPAGGTLVGYAMDGDTVYFVSRRGNQLRGGEGEVAALGGRTGGVLWRRQMGTAHVGGPAARGGIVAVPNRSQFVSLLDGRNGTPLGQVLSKEQAANYVEALPEGLFYGYTSDGAYLLSPETATGVRSSPGFLRAKFPPFVRPVYHFDMYRPELTDYSAIDRNRVLWRVDAKGATATARPSFRDGTVCVLNYRFFFGFDAATGTLRWAYNNPLVEAASAAHTGAAILFATADGELGAIDPRTGRRTYRVRLPGEVITGATFDAEGYTPTSSGADRDTPGGAAGLARVLSSIASDPDRRFSEVQLFAVDQLASIPGREVTAGLLKMLGNEGMSPEVVKRAGRALVDRKDASAIDLFVDAIRVRNDYADGAQSAHLEVLARAVGALGATEAVGPLVEQLGAPETEPAAVLEIARALSSIGGSGGGARGAGRQAAAARGLDENSLAALRDYLTIYRADPVYGADPSALLAVTDALVKLGGPSERELLLFVAEEPKTLRSLREYARRALIQSAEGIRAGAVTDSGAGASRSGAGAP